MEDVYQILIENLTNERLDRIAIQDRDFFIVNKKLDEVMEQYHKLELTEQDAGVINRAFDLHAAQCAKYAACAYRQGIHGFAKPGQTA